MARPITWQDVAAPNLGASLAASQAASDTISNSLKGLGDVAVGYQNAVKADATKQAVASVMGSNDPLAAAAAQPQGWQVDPLAVAAAAQQTDARLRANKASDAQLEGAQLDIKTHQAQLEDLESQRRAELIAQDSWKDTLSGGAVKFNDKYKGLVGQDAVKAGAILEDRLNKHLDRLNDKERLNIERTRANREKFAETLAKNQMLAQGQFYDWAANGGQGADAGTVAAMATTIAQANDLPASYTENLIPLHGTAAKRFVPAANQWGEKVPGQEYTFKDLDNTLRTAESAATTKNAADIGKFEQLNNVSANLAKSQYDGMTDSAAAAALAKQYGWDVGDALERMESAQSSVPKGPDGKRPVLTVAQKAEVAALTEGSALGAISDTLANSDAAKARLAEYSALQQEGGAGVVNDKLSKVQGELLANQAAFETQRRKLYASARTGADAPSQLVKEYDKQKEAQRVQLEAQQKAIQDQADEAQREIDRAVKARDSGKNFDTSKLPAALSQK